MTLDQKEFDSEMAKQKERARNAGAMDTGDWVIVREGDQEFVGYDMNSTPTQILRYRKVKQKGKEFYQVILSKTPFYAEMGGQVGDRGKLISKNGEIINVVDTKRENNIGVHIIEKLPSNPSAEFTAEIDVDARKATSANHSATHLLHEVLREVLGNHVEQKGSFVSPEVLRFDFSHFQKLTPEEIREVEHRVNERIRMAMPLEEERELPIEDARKMGAIALFGEKYGDKVRVVKYGSSIEFCGGTHVENSGNIGMLRILSESSIAAGIRRIEAVSAAGVENVLDSMQDTMRQLSAFFGNASNLKTAVEKAIKENSDLKKQVEEFMEERVKTLTKEVIESATDINGIKVCSLRGERLPEVVKTVAFNVRKQLPEHTMFIGATKEGDKPLLTLSLTDDLVKNGLNASQIIREGAKAIKGGGGGQPFFAQAGGKDVDGLSAALDKVVALVTQ